MQAYSTERNHCLVYYIIISLSESSVTHSHKWGIKYPMSGCGKEIRKKNLQKLNESDQCSDYSGKSLPINILLEEEIETVAAQSNFVCRLIYSQS